MTTNALFNIDYEEDKALELDTDGFTMHITLGNDGLELFHMNVCSLNAKYKQLEVLFQSMITNVFDCLVFSECHLIEEINLNQFQLGEYKIYQSLHNKRRTDGLVIYVRTNLKHDVKETKLTDCNYLYIKIKKLNKFFTIHSFYRSPEGNVKTFLAELKPLLEHSQDRNTTQCIGGDININLLKDRTTKVNEYLNLLAELGFTSLLKKPTRNQDGKISCPDHIFTQLKRYPTTFQRP